MCVCVCAHVWRMANLTQWRTQEEQSVRQNLIQAMTSESSNFLDEGSVMIIQLYEYGICQGHRPPSLLFEDLVTLLWVSEESREGRTNPLDCPVFFYCFWEQREERKVTPRSREGRTNLVLRPFALSTFVTGAKRQPGKSSKRPGSVVAT